MKQKLFEKNNTDYARSKKEGNGWRNQGWSSGKKKEEQRLKRQGSHIVLKVNILSIVVVSVSLARKAEMEKVAEKKRKNSASKLLVGFW